MGSAYSMLLEATLEHLAQLQSQGTQFVHVETSTLRALAPGPVRSKPSVVAPGRPARPGSSSAPVGAATPPRPPAPSLAPVPSPALAPAPVSLSGSSKAEALEGLRPSVLACEKCPHLVRSRTRVVFGEGNPEAELMFVGEAPGEAEDLAGEPFVGPAGQLLTRIIQAMGLTRETVYIANILKCRPDMPAGSRGNRVPTPVEMDTCKPYVLRQIEIIQPKVIVALGATSVLGLLGLQPPLGAVRGRWQDFRGTPVMPTFHPSYLLRSGEGPDRGHREKRKTWEDMLLVLERLGRPVTDRMRGFFLKPSPPPQGE
ncbi:MAG: uracil-DNA glycosylase family protein [Limisphaerales bacterium]